MSHVWFSSVLQDGHGRLSCVDPPACLPLGLRLPIHAALLEARMRTRRRTRMRTRTKMRMRMRRMRRRMRTRMEPRRAGPAPWEGERAGADPLPGQVPPPSPASMGSSWAVNTLEPIGEWAAAAGPGRARTCAVSSVTAGRVALSQGAHAPRPPMANWAPQCGPLPGCRRPAHSSAQQEAAWRAGK